MDEIEIKRALLSLSKMIEGLDRDDVYGVLTIMLAVLVEHNKAIVELVEAGDDC